MNNNLLKEVTSTDETASIVCNTLKDNGIDVVLSGGSCMEIYTSSNFSSYDLDFIASPAVKIDDIKNIMISMGFEEEGRYFKHPDNKYYVEFPTGPLNLGNEFPSAYNEIKTYVGKLILLTATDCIKDRLCAYIYHDGIECYSQAIAVAHLNDIDKDNLSLWAKKESSQMVETLFRLWKDLEFLNKEISDELIMSYLKTKEISNKVNLNIPSEFEELTDDLIEDYIIHILLDVKMQDDTNYFLKMSKFYSRVIS